MDVRRRKRIKRDWSAVFEEFHQSGLSIKKFCQAKEMAQSLFYRRRKDYDDIVNPGKPTLRSSDFIQLKPSAMPRPSASIVFPDHIELSIHNDCDKELLVAMMVREIIKQNPLSGYLFVFRNKRGNCIKLLYWDRDGYAIWYKRLEKGTFNISVDITEDYCLEHHQLSMMLEGIEFAKMKRKKRFSLHTNSS